MAPVESLAPSRPPVTRCAAFSLTWLACFAIPATAGDTNPPAPLQEKLSPEDFHRAGLHKLTPAELEHLNRIWQGEGGETAPIVANTSSPAAPAPAEPASSAAIAVPAPAPSAGQPLPVASATPPPSAPAGHVQPEPASQLEQLSGEDAFGNEERIRNEAERRYRIPKRIESHIAGTFKGWNGRTVFHLDNGQVWRQTDDSQFVINLTDPVIVVEKGAFGTYYLGVKGYGSRAKVERVK